MSERQSPPGQGTQGVRRAWRVLVPIACLLAGLLLAATREASHGHELRSSEPTRLSDLVREAQSATEHVAATRDELAAQRDAAQARVVGADADVSRAVEAIEQLEAPGGLTAMTGPALSVTLTDAPRDKEGNYPEGASPDDLVVHQQDLQSVLNALWAGGADAMQVQDQRIINTSAPRCVGNTLLLHGRAYSPPYVVTAIGDVGQMRKALEEEPGVRLYRQYAARYGLGYEVADRGEVTIPPYEGPLRHRYASAITPPTG